MTDENIYDLPRGSEAISEDITSETESVCEEERVRKLFQACDADGDGYIDSQDLLSVCRELNLEDSIDELMRELGADESGRISYDEFLRRRLALRSEIDALRREQKREHHHAPQQRVQHVPQRARQPEPDYIPTSSDNSLGGASGGKHESWEFDSGARDLSPEPASLQKLVEAAGGSTVSSSPSHLLDLANRLHLAALASLKTEVSELTNRLHATTADRDMLEKSLSKMQLEKMRMSRESEERMEAQAQRYEERLTELHSVIAELTRKLESQRSHVIREDEEEEEELDDEEFDDEACSNNFLPSDTEELSRDVDLRVTPVHTDAPAAVSSGDDKPPVDGNSCTSADIDNRAVEAGQGLHEMVEVVPPILQQQQPTIKDLVDEVVVHKEENVRLQSELTRARSLLATGRDERDKLRKKIQELQASLQSVATLHSTLNSSNQESPCQSPRHVPTTGSPLQTMKQNSLGSSATPSSPLPGLSTVNRDDIPVLKMAERVKLRRMETGDRYVTATDLSSLETWSTPVAEQLVLLQGLQGESSVQELLCRYLATSCTLSATPSCTESAIAGAQGEVEEGKSIDEERLLQQVAGLQQLLPLREFELETERLRARGEHLRAQCDVLTLALDEARANSEKLTLLCGKYESNTTALWLALGHSDAALEAYDVLLALLESELAALVATCRAAGIPAASHCPAVIALTGDHESPGLALAMAGDLRQTAEGVAALLLTKLDRNCDPGSEDYLKLHSDGRSWSQADETRLRNHIGRLKSERVKIRGSTQLGLESVHADALPPRGRTPANVAEARKLDLETAVLMQELMAMREDRAELRARCHALEKERASLELRLSGQEAQRQAQGAALSSLQQQLRDSESRLPGSVPTEDGEGRELTEALAREARLKERIQDMMMSLDTISRTADIRNQQANEMLTEMRRANSSLTMMLDKCKKKYQTRLRKLEHQSMLSIERHSTQVRALKQRISVLESELNVSKCNSGPGANETSL